MDNLLFQSLSTKNNNLIFKVMQQYHNYSHNLFNKNCVDITMTASNVLSNLIMPILQVRNMRFNKIKNK